MIPYLFEGWPVLVIISHHPEDEVLELLRVLIHFNWYIDLLCEHKPGSAQRECEKYELPEVP